jgi:hypothetical protein
LSINQLQQLKGYGNFVSLVQTLFDFQIASYSSSAEEIRTETQPYSAAVMQAVHGNTVAQRVYGRNTPQEWTSPIAGAVGGVFCPMGGDSVNKRRPLNPAYIIMLDRVTANAKSMQVRSMKSSSRLPPQEQCN